MKRPNFKEWFKSQDMPIDIDLFRVGETKIPKELITKILEEGSRYAWKYLEKDYDKLASCDSCDSLFDPSSGGSVGVDNSICRSCLESSEDKSKIEELSQKLSSLQEEIESSEYIDVENTVNTSRKHNHKVIKVSQETICKRCNRSLAKECVCNISKYKEIEDTSALEFADKHIKYGNHEKYGSPFMQGWMYKHQQMKFKLNEKEQEITKLREDYQRERKSATTFCHQSQEKNDIIYDLEKLLIEAHRVLSIKKNWHDSDCKMKVGEDLDSCTCESKSKRDLLENTIINEVIKKHSKGE
jgi:hypothetical protein